MEKLAGYALEANIGGVDALEANIGGVSMLRGADGKSAYQYAVEGGYTGTEEEFAAKLAAEIPAVDATLTQSGQAADAKAVGDALAEMEAAYQPDLPEGYIYVQEIPENADTSKIYVLPDGYAYEYSEHTVIEKHNANTGLVNIKPDTNANYQSLSAQSGVLTSDLIPFSADWVPTTADRANSTIKVSGLEKLVPAYYNSSIIVYLYYADGSWMGAARTSQIDSLGNPALGSEVSVPVEWYLKDTNSAGVVGGWSNVGYVRVLLGISTSGDITSEGVADVVINVPFYDTEQVVTGWARNGEKFAISFSDAIKQNTRDIEGLGVRVSALEASGGGGSGGGEETTVQTNQILYAVGDSITYGYGVGGNSGSWVRHVIDRNGYDATNSRNLGESGLGFCTASTSNHTVQDIVGSTDFSGADIVTVALGINDWKNYNALLTDVWSGMEYVFGKIRTDNLYCKIYFIVPFNVSIATSAYATFYGLGYAGDNNPLRPYAHTLLEFIGMLKERFALSPLNAYNVQIIDLTEGVAINRKNITTALIDNLHPTAETHIELGKEIAPILRFNNHYGQTAAQVQSAIGAIQAWQGGSY